MEGAAGFEKDSRRPCARDYRVEGQGLQAAHLTAAALLHVFTALRIILPATIRQRASSIAWRGKRAGHGERSAAGAVLVLEMVVPCEPVPHTQPHKRYPGDVHPACDGPRRLRRTHRRPHAHAHTYTLTQGACAYTRACSILPPSADMAASPGRDLPAPGSPALVGRTGHRPHYYCLLHRPPVVCAWVASACNPSTQTYDPAGQCPICDLISPGPSASAMATFISGAWPGTLQWGL